MKRSQIAAERIRKEISLCQVLVDYGYDVDIRAKGRGQQFSCDLHGDGQDSKASAHLYPKDDQFFCFACGRSRDAVALVREKEGLKFWQAVRVLEKRYGLDPLPWDGEEEDRPETPSQILEDALNPKEKLPELQARVERYLLNLSRERALPPQRCAGFWEAFDRVQAFLIDGGKESDALRLLHKILASAKSALTNPEEN